MIDLVQNTLDGVMIGSSYGLLALGFTLIFGVMRRLNLSYGPSIMIGAYLGTLLYLQPAPGRSRSPAATVLGAVLAGIYVERLCFAPMAAGAGIASMVSSFAIWMQLEQAAILVLPRHTYPFPPLATGAPLDARAVPGACRPPDHAGLRARAGGGRAARALPHALSAGAARDHRQSGGGASGRHRRATRAVLRPSRSPRRSAASPAIWCSRSTSRSRRCSACGRRSRADRHDDRRARLDPGRGRSAGLLLGVVEAHSQWHFGPQIRDLVAYPLLFAWCWCCVRAACWARPPTRETGRRRRA